MPNAQREDGADPDVAVIHGEDHSTTPPRQSSTSQGLRGSSDKRRNLKRAMSRQRPRTVQAYMGNSPSMLRNSVSSASARFSVESPKNKMKKSRNKARPGSSASVRSDKSEVYTSCAMCHRQRSRFSDFVMSLRKMDTRRKSNTADRRAA